MDVNELILEIAESGREATDEEIRTIRAHVAAAGFEPGRMTRAGTKIDGITWQGAVIRSNHQIENSVAHFLRHTVARQEWPSGITIEEYVGSLRQAIEDPGGGIALERRSGQWGLTFMTSAHDRVGPDGSGWILVGYPVEYGYWTTGYQPRMGLAHLNLNPVEGERWLCKLSSPSR